MSQKMIGTCKKVPITLKFIQQKMMESIYRSRKTFALVLR